MRSSRSLARTPSNRTPAMMKRPDQRIYSAAAIRKEEIREPPAEDEQLPAPVRKKKLELSGSDFPCREVHTPWPPEIYNTGRLMMVRHIVNGIHITTASRYGYPRNPTWPRGHILTNEMLKPLTQQLVLGQSGVRLILGHNEPAGSRQIR